MQNREFEKSIQQKMDELKFVPSDAVWDKVEAGLPEKEKSRRWIFFILFFAAVLFGSLVWFDKTDKTGNTINDKAEVTKATGKQKEITQTNNENEKQTISDSVSLAANKAAITSASYKTNKQVTKASSVRIKIKSGATGDAGNIEGVNDLAGNDQKKRTTKAVVKTRIKAPVQHEIGNEKTEDERFKNEEITKKKTISGDDTTAVIGENKTVEMKVDSNNLLVVNKKDTVQVIVANKEKEKKTNKNSKWQYGIYVASGSSNVTNKLFNNTPVFGGSISAYTAGAPATPPNSVVNIPSNPSGSLAFSTGFFASKSISSSWRFSTGLNYMYQSDAIKTGNRVDTAVTVNYGLNKSISASNYYRAGNTVSYKNKFHLVEIPLLFQFNLFAKPIIYLEAGTTISYLVNSNALVYDVNSSSYITDAAIFNRVLFSANAGIGINVLQKSKLPFSVGYQFKYGAVSVVQKSFGKQHFVNSLLYLKVPLKK